MRDFNNTASTIVRRDVAGNFNAGTITANLMGNASNFTGTLSGDVSGPQSSTVVNFVGGQTATKVAAASILANAATSANTQALSLNVTDLEISVLVLSQPI